MSSAEARKRALLEIWQAAIDAVAGRPAVINAIDADEPFDPDLIVAVGKAASGMCAGALERYPQCPALVVTKYDHSDAELRALPQVEVIESAHPIPDQNSLDAGRTLLERLQSMPADSRLLMLVSGGASALAEALPEGMTLDDLRAITDEMIATGKTIGQINARRKQTSLIKDGKLIAAFGGAEVRVYAISDVEGDGIATIGSGIGDCHRATIKAESTIVASNSIARERAAWRAGELGLEVRLNEEMLYGDVFELAPKLAVLLRDPEPGVYIIGGEPTVMLPKKPGSGGRNQSLALALAEHIEGREDISILVAGTDGTDGPTDAAGGLVDGATWHADARDALERADAGTFLKQHDALFVTGPTNTNVMDLVIAVVD
jgi:hydroxypyruvate reductase